MYSLRCFVLVACAVMGVFGFTAGAQSYAFENFSIPHPPTAFTWAYGINNLGAVVGTVGVGPVDYGFKRFSGGALKYPILDPNNSGYNTFITGINDAGTMVGGYTGTDGLVHGFVDQAGTFTTVDVGSGNQTEITGINYKGDLVGMVNFGAGGFVIVGGVVTQFKVAGATVTFAYGIAADDAVVGCATKDGQNLFFVRSSGGGIRLFGVQGAFGTCAHGINNRAGAIVGFYQTAQDAPVHGFLYNYRANPAMENSGLIETPPITTLDDPGAQVTQVMGINDKGEIAGVGANNAQGPYFAFIATPQ